MTFRKGAKAQPAVTSLVPILVNLGTRLRYAVTAMKQNCSIIGKNTRVATLVCTEKLGGSGGMLPQEFFFDLMLLDGF